MTPDEIRPDRDRQGADGGGGVNIGPTRGFSSGVVKGRRGSQLSKPLGDGFLSISEIAAALGVSCQRVHVMARDNQGFPSPVVNLPRRRLWLAEDVQRYLQARGRGATLAGDQP